MRPLLVVLAYALALFSILYFFVIVPGKKKNKQTRAMHDSVKVGDKVEANQEVAIIEALKMENPVVAPCAGTVNSISVKETDTVTDGQVLMTIA